MSLVIKKILISDTYEQVIDKMNFNYGQIKLNGGGPIGLPGSNSLVKGPPGSRGSIWYYGVGNPNLELFSGLVENDLYLDIDGNIWECSNPLTNEWIQTPVNIKGSKGDDGAEGVGIFDKSDNGQDEHFYYTPQEDLGTGIIDIRAFIFGGYNSEGAYKIPSALATKSNASDAIVYLYTPTAGSKQLKFLREDTLVIADAPAIYTITDNVLVIENKSRYNSLRDGVLVTTYDKDINLNSYRDILLSADGRTTDVTQIPGSTSIGNIFISSFDSASNNHTSPSIIRLYNYLEGTSNAVTLDLKADTKSGSRYFNVSVSKYANYLKLDQDLEIKSRYLKLNSSTSVSTISNDPLLTNASIAALTTEYAIKTYVDTKFNLVSNSMSEHITSEGKSHSFINQNVTTAGTPTFARVSIDVPNQYYVDVTSNRLILKSGDGLYLSGTSSTYYINRSEPDGGSPSKFVFNDGSAITYSSIEANNLISHGYVLLNNNWITPDGTAKGIYIQDTLVGINKVPTVELDIEGNLVTSGTGKITGNLYLTNDSNYLYTLNNSLGIKSGGDQLFITGSSTMSINLNVPQGAAPTKWIWYDGLGLGNYSDFELGSLKLHKNLKTLGNWINYDSDSASGIYITSTNKVKFSSMTASATNYIVQLDTTDSTFKVATANSAYNKNFGTVIGTIPEIGATFINSSVVYANSLGKLTTISAAGLRSLLDLTSSTVSSHYHDQRYLKLTGGTIKNGPTTLVEILHTDVTKTAVLEIKGSAVDGAGQGSGMIYVGQDSNYGGGIMFKGSDTNEFSNLFTDKISFFNRSNGSTPSDVDWTAFYGLSSPDWTFKQNVTVGNDLIVERDIYINNSGVTRSYIKSQSGNVLFSLSDNGNVGIGVNSDTNYSVVLKSNTYAQGLFKVNSGITNLVGNTFIHTGNLSTVGGISQVICSGRIGPTGAIERSQGNFSVQAGSIKGRYTITHNYGSTNYIVLATAISNSFELVSASVLAYASSIFSINTHNQNGVGTQLRFYFAMYKI